MAVFVSVFVAKSRSSSLILAWQICIKVQKFDLRVLNDNRVLLVISILKFDFEVIRERKLVSFVEIIQHKVILQLF